MPMYCYRCNECGWRVTLHRKIDDRDSERGYRHISRRNPHTKCDGNLIRDLASENVGKTPDKWKP